MNKDFSWDQLRSNIKGMSFLLIGGVGFIGHNLALKLVRHGAKVSILDNLMVNSLVDHSYDTSGDVLKTNLNQHFLYSRLQLLKEHDVKLINGDARISDDLRRALEESKPDKIVHLAAIASAVEAKKNPALMFDLQLLSLRNLLELIRSPNFKSVKQVMLLSSSTVYGDFEGDIVDENVRPRPLGIYANTKFMAERLVRTYAHQYGIGCVIIRPSALYGERCVSRRVSQAFIENALFGKPLLLEGGGDGKLDFTYIEDLTDGMTRALAFANGEDDTHTFNITYGNAKTIAELATIIKELLPDAILEERPRAFDKPIRGTLSIERARKGIGFEPSWPLALGYKQYCQWYIAQYEQVKDHLKAAIGT